MTGVAVGESMAGYCRRQGWPAVLARGWLRHGRCRWTALQRAALERGLDLDAGDWLVAAPTSAGKSLVAEVAALHHLFRGEQVVWLTPTRALAESLAADLSGLLAPLGMRVLLAIGDRPDPDRALESGEFELLVAVYEKAFAWLARGPDALARVGLVVADELGMLRDPQRGGRLDLLLTRIARSPHAPRRIGLCAPGGEARALAGWWGGRLLESEDRPRPLREGVLDAVTGRLRWRDRRAVPPAASGCECLPPPAEWQRLLERADAAVAEICSPRAASPTLAGTFAAAALLAGRGEPTLLFAPSRPLARAWTRILARILPGYDAPPAETRNCAIPGSAIHRPHLALLSRLARREPCADHELLLQTLPAGVACHHADLSAPARQLIESAFACGAIRLLVATATLAHGLNLTALNVIHWPRVYLTDAHGRPRETPLERWRWRQQGGRAARLGCGDGPGRSFLVAADEAQHERLWRYYVAGEPGPLRGALDAAAIASILFVPPNEAFDGLADFSRTDVAGFMASTFACHAAPPAARRRLESAFDCARARSEGAGLIASIDGNPDRFRFTRSGRLCASRGFDPAVVAALLPWLAVESDPALEAGDDEQAALPAIWALALAAPPGCWPVLSTVAARVALARARHWFDERGESPPPPLRTLLAPDSDPSLRAASAFEAAWRLAHWIGPGPTPEVEARTGWPAGMLQRAGEGLVWIAHALIDLGRAEDWPEERRAAWRRLSIRLGSGTLPSGLAVATLGLPGLGRETTRRLCAGGLDALSTIAAAPLSHLIHLTQNRPLARQLKSLATARAERVGIPAKSDTETFQRHNSLPPAIEPVFVNSNSIPRSAIRDPNSDDSALRTPHSAPLLDLDLQSPGIVRVADAELRLPPLGWDLLAALAESPGRVLTRESLCFRLWPETDTAPQPQQLDAHRRRLLDRLRPLLNGHADDLIEVVRGIGFRLNLDSGRVRLHRGSASHNCLRAST
jgi:helicase